MTSQPPGNYPPPAGSPPPAAGFDPKAVNPLDWAIIGAGVLAFLLSFIDFYDGADISANGQSASIDTGSFSAWHDVVGGGFFSWFAMVFAVVGAVFVAVQVFQPQAALPSFRLTGLGLFAGATLFELIGIFVTPGESGSALGSSVDVSLNHGFGFWASLIVMIAGTVVSLMRLQATGGALPAALNDRVPNIGGYGPQGGIGGQQQPPTPN